MEYKQPSPQLKSPSGHTKTEAANRSARGLPQKKKKEKEKKKKERKKKTGNGGTGNVNMRTDAQDPRSRQEWALAMGYSALVLVERR
jgi:hypothetical protein